MSIDGKWAVEAKAPIGSQNLQITFASDGDSLTGKVSGPNGVAELANGKIDGSNLSWDVKVANPVPVTVNFQVEIDGDSMSGTFKVGFFANGTVTGSRM